MVGEVDVVGDVPAFIDECFVNAGENPHQADHKAHVVDNPIICLSDEIVRKRRGRGNVNAIIQPVV